MRKFVTLCLATAFAVPVMAQNRQGTKLATPEMINARATYQPKLDQLLKDPAPMVRAYQTVEQPMQNYGNARVNAVNPIPIGRASNAFTCLRNEQNQVAAVDSLDLVAFIHRQDITIWGGASTDNGRYRFDFSTDAGATWNNDIGTLQNTYLNYGRYPNMTIHNSSGNNPFDAKVVYGGPTNKFPTPGWIGHVYGVSEITAVNPPAAGPENYVFDTEQTLLPGGMCMGLPGEYWGTEFQYDGTSVTDTVRILKGTWNAATGDVDWAVAAKVTPGYDVTFDGSISAVGPNIAFSPDGMTGWVAMLSNVTAGTNTNNETLLPVFMKSTDGGATWGPAMEADLDAIPWIADSLQSLWIDSLGNPASDGRATTGFDFDLTVDMNGNAHMGVVIGTSGGGFAISSGLAKFYADVHTSDGGATWDAAYISPVLAFRGDFGTGDPITMDNFCQISRSEDGSHIFYSWVDTDTAQYTGNMTGTGFGESAQLAPNLRTASMRVSDGYQTYPNLVTDGDLIWEGRALIPTMAPTVIMKNGNWHLPIVILEMLANDPGQPCQFHYFGEDATISTAAATYCDPAGMGLGWNQFGFTGANNVCVVGVEAEDFVSDVILHQSFPNPTTNQAVIGFELPVTTDISLDLVNIYGQTVGTLANGEHRAGLHRVNVETSDLAAGVYFYNLRVAGHTFTKKMIVTK